MSDVFVDTNVVVYAHDSSDAPRREIARNALKELWETGRGIVSVQVLQETYHALTRKLGLPRPQARDVVRAYVPWAKVLLGPLGVLRATDLEEQHQLSFWDALIVAAAQQGGADTILSEDLAHGRVFDGVRVVNPFREAGAVHEPVASYGRKQSGRTRRGGARRP